MSRHKSDGKRKAILEAALCLFAERGVAGTPTSAISKKAGVAEGTLFTYFKTKDELVNELYLALRGTFDAELKDYPGARDVRTRLRFCVGQVPGYWTETSKSGCRCCGSCGRREKLLKENEAPGVMLQETIEGTQEAIRSSEFSKASEEFLVLLLRAHGEATVEYITAHPGEEAYCRELGFKLIWRGMTGQ